jgi:ribosome-associated toxin RatA of RatAB toxin-antitoxin module
MVSIYATVEMNASLETVWGIVSDTQREPEFWKGLNSVKIARKEGNLIEQDIDVGFMGHKVHQIIRLHPKTSIDVEMTEGPMVGTRKINLVPVDNGKTRVEASWNFSFSKVPVFARSFAKSQIESSTQEALEKIASQAEMSYSPKVALVSSK